MMNSYWIYFNVVPNDCLLVEILASEVMFFQGESADGHDEENFNITLKLLIPGSAAGSIIGKGGATINEIQTQTSSRIQLSRNDEVFPGTTDRIVTLGGTITAVLGALHLILSKLLRDGAGLLMGQNPQLNLVIPNASCGCIIGKGGVTIRSFAEDSRAEIKLSPQGGMLPGVSERILSIAGRIDSILRAVALVATALSDDDDYEALVARQSTYTNCPGGTVLRREHSSPPKANANNTFGSHRNDVSVSVMLALPDEHIGAVLGKSGRTISEIQVVTGARIKISDRGDFLEGTKNRKVILTGMEEGVRMAQSLLEQKIEANSSYRVKQMQLQFR